MTIAQIWDIKLFMVVKSQPQIGLVFIPEHAKRVRISPATNTTHPAL